MLKVKLHGCLDTKHIYIYIYVAWKEGRITPSHSPASQPKTTKNEHRSFHTVPDMNQQWIFVVAAQGLVTLMSKFSKHSFKKTNLT